MVELLGLILSLSVSTTAHAQNNEPDMAKERSLHYLYRKYNRAPTAPERWEEVLKRSSDSNYSIQKGDTLWDISNTFFGDPNFWPKIWSLNSEIQNPHEILPQGNIVFVPGSLTQAPTMGMKKVDPSAPPEMPSSGGGNLAAAGTAGADAKMQPHGQIIDIDLTQIVIPPPSKGSSQAASLPSSIPAYKFQSKEIEEQAAIVEVTPVHRVVADQPLLVTHYVSDSEPTPVGSVVETETGSFAAGEGASIFVKLATAQPGQRFLVIKTIGPVKHAEVDTKGYVNQVDGQIEIREQVNPSQGIYRASVIKSVALIEVGDELVAEEIPYAQPTPGAALGSATAQVMGGQYSRSRGLFGDTNVLFLSSGSTQGLSAGMVLPIYRNPKYRTKDSVVELNPIRIGQIQVVRVDEGTATAVVLNALDEIQVGDMTSPTIQK